MSERNFAACLEFLEAVAEDRSLLQQLDREQRVRLLSAANRVAQPDRTSRRLLRRELRRQEVERVRSVDERRLNRTGIRLLRSHPTRPDMLPALGPDEAKVQPPDAGRQEASLGAGRLRLAEARNCYVCKADFCELHTFYDQLCPSCAALNWEKRLQSADLRGRVAMVTGGRVKIGFQTAHKLLRAGARVIVTTRFPRDAAARFARLSDSAEWRDRLAIYGLDLRHLPSVEVFVAEMENSLPQLDTLIHNACQTVRRPAGFYRHLMEAERAPFDSLQPLLQEFLQGHERLVRSVRKDGLWSGAVQDPTALRPRLPGMTSAPELSQLALLAEDAVLATGVFPEGVLDSDLQQVDLRDTNSWRLRLHEVSSVELLEVFLINAAAPFVLSGRLRALMNRRREADRHIVNVSAVEGQFYRAYKTDKHPHTNMAKAALNMLTRTSALDYIQDGIHMNAVDTGWITDEDPVAIAARKRSEMRFHPPLDAVDGAARILDPIFHGMRTGVHRWGKFFKDYQPTHW